MDKITKISSEIRNFFSEKRRSAVMMHLHACLKAL